MNKTLQSFKIFTGAFLASFVMMATLFVIGAPATANADTLNRQLELGSTGSDVTALQIFLAQDSTLYPEGKVTGYFGSLTKAAVVAFQIRNGISAIGRVGPVTLLALNTQTPGGIATSSTAPTISNVNVNSSRNSVIVNWNTNESAKGLIYYSPTPLVTYEYPHSVDVSGSTASTDANYRTNQSVLVQGLQPSAIYYYMIYTTDQGGNVSVTWPGTFQTSY
jgi:peptidoglycan hydrolase-like protein with peptidoglycan-binding domain